MQQIRDDADYPGLRLRMQAALHTAHGTIVWDVSTGDPIVPAPRLVRVPRALGEDIQILGYAPETAVAEKGVTILERGITSTRWRDYVDIVQLSRNHSLDPTQLRAAAEAVAAHRHVTLEAVSPHLAGYGAVQAMPGPLFTFAAFLGASASGPASGCISRSARLCSRSSRASRAMLVSRLRRRRRARPGR